MRKKLAIYSAIVVLAVFLTACNSTANAIVDYNNDFIMEKFVKEEQEYIDLHGEYEKVVNETDNDLERREAFITDEILPKSQELLDLVKKNNFEDEVVQDLHNLLVESEELRHESVEKERDAVQNDSQTLFIEAQSIAVEGEKLKQEFMAKMDSLKDEYNLEDQDE